MVNKDFHKLTVIVVITKVELKLSAVSVQVEEMSIVHTLSQWLMDKVYIISSVFHVFFMCYQSVVGYSYSAHIAIFGC